MNGELVGDPGHWRQRAKEARALAETMDGERKRIMLRIARDYDALAERAEQRRHASHHL